MLLGSGSVLRVLIVDEPTRGVDVGAKSEIYNLLRNLAETGVGIIMISSDLPEILGVSDRIMVIREGRNVGIIPASEATEEKVIALASWSNQRVTVLVQSRGAAWRQSGGRYEYD